MVIYLIFFCLYYCEHMSHDAIIKTLSGSVQCRCKSDRVATYVNDLNGNHTMHTLTDSGCIY